MKKEAAYAQHDLFIASLNTDDWSGALRHAEKALEIYPVFNRSFARFALDFGLLMLLCGQNARAKAILGLSEPLWTADSVWAAGSGHFALACVRTNDKATFKRLSAAILDRVHDAGEFASVALAQLADAHRLAGDWETAEQQIERSIQLAMERDDATALRFAANIREKVLERTSIDSFPNLEQQEMADRLSRQIIRRLKRQRDRFRRTP